MIKNTKSDYVFAITLFSQARLIDKTRGLALWGPRSNWGHKTLFLTSSCKIIKILGGTCPPGPLLRSPCLAPLPVSRRSISSPNKFLPNLSSRLKSYFGFYHLMCNAVQTITYSRYFLVKFLLNVFHDHFIYYRIRYSISLRIGILCHLKYKTCVTFLNPTSLSLSRKTLRRGYYTTVMLVLWKLQFFNYYLTAKQKLNLNVNSL